MAAAADDQLIDSLSASHNCGFALDMSAPPVLNSPSTAPVQPAHSSETALPDRILWIVPPNDDFEHYVPPETVIQKGWRKTKENPLVPVGAALTVGALSTGLYAMQRGDMLLSQHAMRGRVIFQGLTIGMIVLGMVYGVNKDLKRLDAENQKKNAELAASPVSSAMSDASAPKPPSVQPISAHNVL